MKNPIYILTIITLILSSCFADRGNYDYKPLPDIVIGGMDELYTVYAMEQNLVIEPTVATDLPESDLEYIWVRHKTDHSDEDLQIDTLNKDNFGQKNLDVLADFPEGSSKIALIVRSKKYDYHVRKTSDLTVTTRFARGFYVLKQTPQGIAELDLHIDQENSAMNLLENAAGISLTGTPTRLNYIFGASYIDRDHADVVDEVNLIMPMTTNDAATLNVSDLSLAYTHDEMFYAGTAPDESPLLSFTGYYFSGYGYFSDCYYVSSSGVYIPTYGPQASGKFGYSIVDDPGIKHAAKIVDMGMPGIVYFSEKDRLIKHGNYNSTISSRGSEIDHTCVYMGTGNGGGMPMSVFQDKDDPALRHLYVMSSNSGVVKTISLDGSLHISAAVLYAPLYSGANILFGVADNKIFRFDTDTETETQVNPQGLGTDETITYIANKYVMTGASDYRFDYLVVATLKDGGYKIYCWGMTGGSPQGGYVRLFEGEGKVIDIQYCLPDFDRSYPDSYN